MCLKTTTVQRTGEIKRKKNEIVYKTLVMLLLCILYASVEGRGIWGNKRRREEVERNAEAAGGVEIEEEVMARGFEATRRQAQVVAHAHSNMYT